MVGSALRLVRFLFLASLCAIAVLGLSVKLATAHGVRSIEPNILDQGSASVRVETDVPLTVSVVALGYDLLLDLREANLVAPHLVDQLDPFDGVYYRGAVAGDSNSWASLRMGARGVHGAIGFSAGLLVLGEDATATLYDAATSLFEGSQPRALAPVAELELAVVADTEFAAKHGSATATRMADIVASFATVFADQLGIQIRITASKIFSGKPDPFTEFNSGNLFSDFRDAATEFGEWREDENGDVEAADLAHLFMDKSFSNAPPLNAGFGFFDEVCDVDRGVSISTAQSPAAPSFQGLILAHEIGHNFDARHDGESPCSSAPSGHIMAAAATGNSFSDCSADVIRATRDSVSCLDPPVTTTTSTTTTTLPPVLCGDATGDGKLGASDALEALRTAVGSSDCELCVCDVKNSGSVAASDALLILQAAVAIPVVLECPSCNLNR